MTSRHASVDLAPLTQQDVLAVADIHLAAFPMAALTALGREAVRRQYRWYLSGPHDALCEGAWVDGKLAGFCFSGVFNGATGGFICKNRPYLIGRVLLRPWLLWNPLFRDRAMIALRILNPFRPRRTPIADAPWWDQYGILAIAVDPAVQGSGVGRALMDSAESTARKRGVPRMILSVNPENYQAVRFYERLCWDRIENQGRWVGEMSKNLDQNDS